MQFHHIGLEVKNLDESIRFYTRFFGLSPGRTLELDGEKIVFLKGLNGYLELIEANGPRSDPAIHLAFQIGDMDAEVKRLWEKGVTIAEGINTWDFGLKNAFVLGPDGEWIELVQILR
ncbi:MAG: VOC family protein [Thermoactinomyces sp.]